MKKTYIQPLLEVTLVHTVHHLLAGSPTGTTVNETQAESGSSGFSRRRYSIWDDDEE